MIYAMQAAKIKKCFDILQTLLSVYTREYSFTDTITKMADLSVQFDCGHATKANSYIYYSYYIYLYMNSSCMLINAIHIATVLQLINRVEFSVNIPLLKVVEVSKYIPKN